MQTITSVALVLALALGFASAQNGTDIIEVDYLTVAEWRVLEVEWAGEEPYADATSTFDGRCSVPAHFLAHGEGDMINFPMGRHAFHYLWFCGRLTFEVDAEGARVFTDVVFVDGEYRVDQVEASAFYTARLASVETVVDPLTGGFVLMMQHIDLSAHDIALPGLSFVSGDLSGPTIVYDVEAVLAGALPMVTLVQGSVRFAPDD